MGEPGCLAESQNQPAHSMSSASTGWNEEVRESEKPSRKPSDFLIVSRVYKPCKTLQAIIYSQLYLLTYLVILAMFCV